MHARWHGEVAASDRRKSTCAIDSFTQRCARRRASDRSLRQLRRVGNRDRDANQQLGNDVHVRGLGHHDRPHHDVHRLDHVEHAGGDDDDRERVDACVRGLDARAVGNR